MSAWRGGDEAKTYARRTVVAVSRAPSSADHQKLETYTDGSPRRARCAPTRRPVSRAAASLPSHLSSTFTPMRPRQKSRTWSSSSSPSLVSGRSCAMTSEPRGMSQTSVSTSSHARSIAFWNEAMVLSGACPFAPRCPIRRTRGAYLGAAGVSSAAMKFPAFEMERMQSVWEHKVKYDLSESGVEPLTLEEAARDVKQLLGTKLGYAEGVGLESTRTFVSQFHRNANAGNVVITTGTSEANFLAMLAL